MSGATEHEVITADFNGDHLPDLAVLRLNAIDILVNQGNGTFALKQTLTTGRQASYMQAADLGNGHLDLIVSNVADGTLDIFNGNGNGTFTSGAVVVKFGTAQAPGFSGTVPDIDAFAVTNLNSGGKPDIVVADGVDNQLVTLINQGTGTFSLTQTIPTLAANSPIGALATGSGVATGIVVLDQNAPVVLLFANQSGTLTTSPTQLSLGAPAQTFKAAGSLVVGDFNGDGIPDIAATINAITGNTSFVSVLLGKTGGTFQLAQRNAVPANSDGLAVGDFNGDGRQDLLLGTNNNANIDILTGNGDGTFTDQNLSLTKGLGDGQEIAVADFNGDGKQDFVVAPATSAVSLFINNGAAGVSSTTTALAPSSNPASSGQTVTFTATVTSSGGTPTGSVQFFDLSTLLATEALSGGVASFADTSLSDGTHDITAQYVGATQFASSTSNLVLETIGAGLGNGIGLSPTITRSTVPVATASGLPVRGTVTLKVMNTNAAADVGNNVIGIFATTDGVVDDSSVLLKQVNRRLNLKTGRSQTIVVPINSSTVPIGAYTIVAQATDASSNVITSTTGPTLTVAAPFINLAVTFGNIPRRVLLTGAPLIITNTGNVDDTGTFTAVVGLANDSGGTDIVGTNAGALAPARLIVRAGKARRIHVTGWNTLLKTLASNGPFFLTVTVTDANGNSASAVSGGEF